MSFSSGSFLDSSSSLDVVSADENVTSRFQRCTYPFRRHYRGILLILIPPSIYPLFMHDPRAPFHCAYVITVMILFWLLRLLPQAVVSLLPLILLPCLSVLSTDEVCSALGHDVVFMWLGGCAIAIMIQQNRLNVGISLFIVRAFSANPKTMQVFITFTAMLTSMFLPNFLTCTLFCPFVKCILSELAELGMIGVHSADPPDEYRGYQFPSKPVMGFYLGLAYATTIGGTITMSPENIECIEYFHRLFPDAKTPYLRNYTKFLVPMAMCNMFVVLISLQFLCMGLLRPKSEVSEEIQIALTNTRRVKTKISLKIEDLTVGIPLQMLVATLIIILILGVNYQKALITVWVQALSTKAILLSFPTILICIVSFMVPANFFFMKYLIREQPRKKRRAKSLLSWQVFNDNMIWDQYLIFASSYALSSAMRETKLCNMIVDILSSYKDYPKAILLMLCMLISMFMTIFSSNLETANNIIPLILEKAVELRLHPEHFGIAASLAISIAYLLPISTPTNAIAAGWCHMRFSDMALYGSIPTILTFFVYFIGITYCAPFLYPDFETFPDWANKTIKK